MNVHNDQRIDQGPEASRPLSTSSSYSNDNPNFFVELFKFALIALVIVLPVRVFVAQPFIVSGSSMEPTFSNGEYLIVDELSYHIGSPERGDVVVFRYPKEPSVFFIKRVIGLPGETLTIKAGSIFISNNEHPDGFELTEPYVKNDTDGDRVVSLSSTEYYVLGDNRPSSSDSRVWGPLPEDNIVGRAFFRLLPVTRIQALPGSADYSESSEL